MALTVLGLIPARAGSKRIPDKNIFEINGHPMLAYTIAAARESGIYARVLVSTDSEKYAAIARHYGAEVPFLRGDKISGDTSRDVEWVSDLLERLRRTGDVYDCFSILRPTSPFRQASTIRRAWEEFSSDDEADSLRAVEKCRQHPGKMWVLEGERMTPLLNQDPSLPPMHSSQYASLPPVYVQNASLEIARCRVVTELGNITGERIRPFLTRGHEGLDINEPRDLWYANYLSITGEAELPAVAGIPWDERVEGSV